MIILGIHGGPRGTHEAGVALIKDGETLAVLMEERYNRYKNAHSCFPHYSLKTLLKKFNLKPEDIDVVAHPGVTYEDMKHRWKLYLDYNFGINPKTFFPVNHQIAHAASSFYYTDLEESLVVSLDGVGDGLAGMICLGKGAKLTEVEKVSYEQSIGFFWNILCQYIGFEPLEEAYKTMGLAPYGSAKFDFDQILDFKEGKIIFDYTLMEDKWNFVSKSPLERYFSEKLKSFFNFPPRKILMPLRQEDKDIAASAQKHLEKVLGKFFAYYLEKYQQKNLCFSGGVSLNSKACGDLNTTLGLKKFFVTPCPSDGGLALGSALYAYAEITGKRPMPILSPYQGLAYDENEILEQVKISGLKYKKWDSFKEIAELLAKDAVFGVLQGRSEYGPRALGCRSIIASPIKAEMRDLVNKKIKFREEYRPFAPAICDNDFKDYFERGSGDYSYMSFTINAKELAKKKAAAIVHVDGTSRVQEVKKELNPFFYNLLQAFKSVSGSAVLMNTSFNLKGEPIVETPADAIRTFVSSGLDYLVLENYLISKN